MYDITE